MIERAVINSGPLVALSLVGRLDSSRRARVVRVVRLRGAVAGRAMIDWA